MRMMMGSDGTEQDMQWMMDGSDSMGESADGDELIETYLAKTWRKLIIANAMK